MLQIICGNQTSTLSIDTWVTLKNHFPLIAVAFQLSFCMTVMHVDLLMATKIIILDECQ